ncbi:MAG: hypothetical protein QM690_03150 [Sphingobium sp.]
MMGIARRLLPGAAMATALLLAGCAKSPPPATLALPDIPTARPLPPMGAAADLTLPDVDAQGQYITPNRGMTGQQALWHVRMALNVAALGCRDAGDVMGAEYNRMLGIHARPLAQANSAADAIYATRYGTHAAEVRDKVYTVVYNYFALPPAQKAFCETARAVVATINGMTPDALIPYAPQALALLEKPFQDFWAAYADYLRRLELWRRLNVTVEVLPCPDTDPACTGTAPPSPRVAPVPSTGLPRPLPVLAPAAPPSGTTALR